MLARTIRHLASRDTTLYRTLLNGNFGLTNTYHVVTGSGTNSTAVLDGFTIEHGAAPNFGGGMFNVNGSPTVENCIFEFDSAVNGGGAVYNDLGAPTFINCAFRQNRLTTTSVSGYNGIGGAVFNDSGSSSTFTNCTFTSNTAVDAGGAMGIAGGATATLANCILWNDTLAGNSAQELFVDGNDGGVANVQYSDVQGGFAGSPPTSMRDPLVHRAANNPQTSKRLSPAINAGLNSAIGSGTMDAAGNPRIAGTFVDMGAYEYQGPFVLYVDQNVSGGDHSGSSWTNALTTLQPALRPGYTVFVAQGTYNPNAGAASFSASATFQLQDNLTILGGFAGAANPAAPGTRNISLYPTILTGAYFSFPHTFYVSHVVTGSGVNSSAILNGFTITNNRNVGTSGGGLFDNAGSPQIVNCTFSGDVASSNGGAIENENSSNPLLADCIFTNNSALYGGAISNESNSSPYILNCAFFGDSAVDYGGAIYSNGASATLVNCSFTANSALQGGALSNGGSTITATNCIFWNDSGSQGNNEIVNAFSVQTITYSDVDQSGFTGNHNIDADPKFVSGANLQLQNGSPAIDTGNTNALALASLGGFTADLAGNPRVAPANGNVDMGAYEFQGATGLVFAPGPTGVNVNAAEPNIVVNIEQNGQISKGDNSTVTLSILSGPAGGVLSGASMVPAVQGQATFTGISFSKAGNYQLIATDGTDTSVMSAFFSVTAVNTTPHLVFTVPTSNVIAGQIMSPAVVVDIEQPDGSILVTDQSPVNLSFDGGEFLSSALAVNGVATFSNLQFAQTGMYTVVATDSNDGAAALTGNPFTVGAAAAPVSLAFGFVGLPNGTAANIFAGSVISPAVTVTEVQNGVTLTSDNSSTVTLSLFIAPSGGTINGTFTAPVINGVATFSHLTPTSAGIYEISASDGSDAGSAFEFSAGTPAVKKLVFTQQPPDFALGDNIAVPTFKVAVEINGVIQNDSDQISVILSIPSAGAYTPRQVNAVNGVATFSNFFVGQAAPMTIEAFDTTDPSATPGVSRVIQVSPGPEAFLCVSGFGQGGSS